MLKKDVANLVRGFCMGIADVVPGVSGGTVAFVLGIYEQLVESISNADTRFARLVFTGKLRAAAERINLRFLIALGVGIVLGLITMLMAVGYLLSNDQFRPFTLAAFMGMILGSAIVLIRSIKIEDKSLTFLHWAIGIDAMAVAACVAVQTNPNGISDPSLWYVFVCGAIAICAMILPGISGAMILLLLGIYAFLSDIPHALKAREDVGANLVTLVVFGCGCAIGLATFSRGLRWLLSKHRSLTFAALCGLMVGSLPKLWPFQKNVTPEIEDFKKATFHLVEPSLNGTLIAVIATAIVAMVVVVVAESLVSSDEPIAEEQADVAEAAL